MKVFTEYGFDTFKCFTNWLIHLTKKGVNLVIVLFLLASCEDYVDIDPPETSLVGETVFQDDITATSAMLGVYSRMIENSSSIFTGNSASVTLLSGWSSDELLNYSSSVNSIEYVENELLDNNPLVRGVWNGFYQYIYSCNSILEGIMNSDDLSPELVQQFEGEAKFIRALCYFYLVNFWGDVPLVLGTNFEANATLPRETADNVYNAIIQDLLNAQTLLSDEYISEGKIRPNSAVATALLARVYLYTEDFANAEMQASSLINNSNYSLEINLDDVFLINSQESIWQLQSVFEGVGTFEALAFVLTRAPTRRGVSLRPEFAEVFEPNDSREMAWLGSLTSRGQTFYYPFKYKERLTDNPTQYLTVFRLAEQFLIRSEARARQGNLQGALDDLNVIRNRAGLPNSSAVNLSDLTTAIEQERRVELFAEFGHRWLDLKRTGRATAILSSIKPNWQETDVLWPVPLEEFLNNPNLGEQNPGY